MKIGVVGGAGAMGRFICRFLKERGFDVGIYDPSERSVKVAEEIGARLEKVEDVGKEDAVIVSVPIKVASNVIREVGGRMRRGALLVDITSVKRATFDALKECRNVRIFNIHPLFGPTVEDLRGQKIVVIKMGEIPEKAIDFLKREGADLVFMDVEEHDSMMQLTQALSHFINLSIASVIRKSGLRIDEIEKYSTPTFELVLDLIGRSLSQTPELFSGVQIGFMPQKLYETFIDECRHILELIERSDDEKLEEIFERCREIFDDLELRVERTDRMMRVRKLGSEPPRD